MASFIIVRNDAVVRSLAELRGLRAANNHESSSGSNFFRAEIAALAGGGHFFSEVIETGGHGASIGAVTSGKADDQRSRPALRHPQLRLGW